MTSTTSQKLAVNLLGCSILLALSITKSGAEETVCNEEPLDPTCKQDSICQYDYRCITQTPSASMDRKDLVCKEEIRCKDKVVLTSKNANERKLREIAKLAKNADNCLKIEKCQPTTVTSNSQQSGESQRAAVEASSQKDNIIAQLKKLCNMAAK